MSTSPHQDQTSQTAKVLRALGYEFNCFFFRPFEKHHIFSRQLLSLQVETTGYVRHDDQGLDRDQGHPYVAVF